MDEPRELAPRDIIASGLCIGCGACSDRSRPMKWDAFGQRQPRGPGTAEPSATFTRTCPFSPHAANEDLISAARYPQAPLADDRIGRFEAAYVGHVEEGAFRAGGSSGGMVSWVAAELLASGAVDGVAHVVPSLPDAGGYPFFRYRISRTLEDVREGAQSRYYPVDLAEVLAEVRSTPGRYAVVGVPCFIKAMHLARAEDPVVAERVTHLLGLFCGHMKSARFVDSFAWQLGAPIGDVRAVDYRRKDPGRPANWYTAQLTLADGSARWRDWWHLADGDWGAGFFQYSACNFCDDVVAETADIALGDAWVEPYSSDGRGTNVVVIRTPELNTMLSQAIADGRLSLKPVDADFIADTQAAGLRQRREGLAYRLSWHRRGITPRKRVAASRQLPWKRKLIYRLRAAISYGSHRMAWLARRSGHPMIYVRWASLSRRLYHRLAYGQSRDA